MSGSTDLKRPKLVIRFPSRCVPLSVGQVAKAGFITLYKALPVFSLIRTITPQDTAFSPNSKMEPEAQRGQGDPERAGIAPPSVPRSQS